MQLPEVRIDLSAIVVSVVGVLLVAFARRSIKAFDDKFETFDSKFKDVREDIADGRKEFSDKHEVIHQRIDQVKSEVLVEVKDVKLDLKATQEKLVAYKDKTTDSITAVRLALEDKHEILDERIRKLEVKNDT